MPAPKHIPSHYLSEEAAVEREMALIENIAAGQTDFFRAAYHQIPQFLRYKVDEMRAGRLEFVRPAKFPDPQVRVAPDGGRSIPKLAAEGAKIGTACAVSSGQVHLYTSMRAEPSISIRGAA